ncbi:hypothetical protein PILCRDRAFT_822564 [Piloderma croceum F 1598]|uniref:DUF2415 domain-containing protein n=1 Tax=Piloderma croceum (strain F 1598) TaxID=765440 RepID=A0A0C3FKF9_PILCF|nr:hypothetical protein PILCRDRAFT_822564 [Piloderma croceum F 1598]
MACDNALLTSPQPTNVASASVTIGHVQLRDVLICPRERGVVNYIQNQSIVEHNINAPDSTPRKLANLAFVPNTLASMKVHDTDNVLIAAGGQDAEIHLSLHRPPPSDEPHRRHHRQRNSIIWQLEIPLQGSINNSVLLTSMSLARSHESSVEPRVGVSNNDSTVKFFDIPVRGDTTPPTIKDAGTMHLDVAVNHSSLSPDGQTLLSVGDSPKVYLHHLSGGSQLTFTPITTLSLPPPDGTLYYTSSNLAASFSTSFSSNGTKFAVASQEGSVVVWDVRSSKPLKIFQTDKTRMPAGRSMNSGASGWLSDDPWDWSRGGYQAPGWGVRSVKFGSSDSGREVMTFTEHTSLLHVIDARTFETEEIVRMPSCTGQGRQPPPLSPIPSPRAESRSRSYSPIPRSRSYSPINSSSSRVSVIPPSPPPPPRIVHIPSPNVNDARTRWRASHLRNRVDTDEDVDRRRVVIPPLSDVLAGNEVRQLFGRHGIRTRHAPMESLSRTPTGGPFEVDVMYDVAAEDEQDRDRDRERARENADGESMEVDELETDCISSHTPSRSSSPSPSTHIPLQFSPPPSRVVPRYHQVRHRRQIPRKEDLDLAGMCFDPSGAFIYVASVDGVAEWSVRGAEKRWWFGSGWA